MDPRAQFVFLTIKEPCVALASLARVPSARFDPDAPALADALERLETALAGVPAELFGPQFADYVFFPLAALLQKPALGERASVYMLKVLEYLVKNGWGDGISQDLAKQLFILLAYMVSVEHTPGATASSNQGAETQTKQTTKQLAAACSALLQLLTSIAVSPASLIFSSDTSLIPTISHTVSALLAHARNTHGTAGPALHTQTLSLRALLLLLSGIKSDSDALAMMLPAVVSNMSQILADPERRHYTVHEAATRVLTLILPTVFNDAALGLRDEVPTSLAELAAPHGAVSFSGSAVRTAAWLAANKQQVRMALGVVPFAKLGSRPELRAAFAALALGVLEASRLALDTCTSQLLDIALRFAEPLEMARLVGRAPGLAQLVQERVYDYISAFPRLLAAHDDTQAAAVADAAERGVVLLERAQEDADVFKMLYERLVAIVQESVSVTASSRPAAVAERGVLAFREYGVESSLTPGMERRVAALVGRLGGLAGSQRVLREMVDKIGTKPATQESVLAAWLVVSSFGVSGKSDEDLTSELYTFCITRLSVPLRPNPLDTLLTAAALRGTALVSTRLGPAFRPHLATVLYPLTALSSSSSLSLLARETLTTVATQCGYADARAMILSNYDYVVDALAVNLNAQPVEAAAALAAAVRVAGPQMLPYLDDVVAALLTVLDMYHGYVAIVEAVFGGLAAVVSVVEVVGAKVEEEKKRVGTFVELLNVLEKPKVETVYDEMETEGNPGIPFSQEEQEGELQPQEEEPQEESWDCPVPRPTWTLFKHISEYCDRFLPHSRVEIRLLALRTLRAALPVLATAPQSAFLPVASTLWPALARALQDEVPAVQRAAAEAVGVLIEKAGEFMGSRLGAIVGEGGMEQVLVSALRHVRLDKGVVRQLLVQNFSRFGKEPELAQAFEEQDADAVWFLRVGKTM